MVRDMICYVTSLQQTAPPEEDRSGDPVVPRVMGGEVFVVAQCGEGQVQFAVDVTERIAIGDSVHVTLDVSGPAEAGHE